MKHRPFYRTPASTRRKTHYYYDLETTRIASGTPDLRYFVMCDSAGEVIVSERCESLTALADIIKEYIYPRTSARFIAWNGNKYDAYFMRDALLTIEEPIEIRPYLARGGALRGMRVLHRENTKIKFEILDGMSMISAVPMKLSKAAANYCPELPKLSHDFDESEFDASNPMDVAYAERDVIALAAIMERANEIVQEKFGTTLAPTLGKTAVNVARAHMPDGAIVWRLSNKRREIVQNALYRGGYCWVAEQYHGPVFKADENQAYGAAQRDTALPCGPARDTDVYMQGYPGFYHVRIDRTEETRVPFYCFDEEKNRMLHHDGTEKVWTWIHNEEMDFLIETGWNVELDFGVFWYESFDLSDFVNKLEEIRYSDPSGPSGPIGMLAKGIGCSAYGKFGEMLSHTDTIIARDCPDGALPANFDDEDNTLWYLNSDEDKTRDYHQVQLASFITAHVRVKQMRASIACGDDFLMCDTDSVAAKSVPPLDYDAREYGKYKIETDGNEMVIIGRKCYADIDAGIIHTKGLYTREITIDTMLDWYDGKIPMQNQLQRNSFKKTTSDVEMFHHQERRGTDFWHLSHVRLEGRLYRPMRDRLTNIDL
jgi:hypothetical protein